MMNLILKKNIIQIGNFNLLEKYQDLKINTKNTIRRSEHNLCPKREILLKYKIL
jgi:hypothetical protein